MNLAANAKKAVDAATENRCRPSNLSTSNKRKNSRTPPTGTVQLMSHGVAPKLSRYRYMNVSA